MDQDKRSDAPVMQGREAKKPAKKQPLIQLLTNKNGRKMTKAEMQMAGSVVLVCALAAVLVIAVKMFA